MNETERPLTIPAALRRAAASAGDHPAYIEVRGSSERSVTWRELADRARAFAAGLVGLGLAKGDRVAICAENGIDWLTAFLGTVTAGGAGVLVYYDLRTAEIEDQVGRPECRFLVASASVLPRLPADLPALERVIVIDGEASEGAVPPQLPFEALIDGESAEAGDVLAGREPAPEDLAALIFTSGTTGGAKGVMLSHRNFLANAHAVLAALDVGGRDVLLLVLPLHHAMPLMAAVVLPTLVGAQVVIENDLRRVRDRIQAYRPTVFFGVPALYEIVYRNVLARAEAEGRLPTLQRWQARLGAIKRVTGLNLAPLLFRPVHKALGGRLRFLVSGGAALNPETARDFAGLGLPLLQGWGMSEASPTIAIQRFSRRRFLLGHYYERHAGSVGEPLPGVEVRLVDLPEKDIRVADYGEGEVVVRGENVFQGYWQAPEATAAALRDGWLYTGDLGRIDAEGNIWLTGRSKYIIVLDSGEKVHPDELEEKLARSELIEDVCVLGRKARDRTQVTAVIYPRVEAIRQAAAAQGTDLSEAGVRSLIGAEAERLGQELAAYKRVGRIELSDAPLPKTALRKVARGQVADDYAFDLERWLASAAAT